MDETELQRERRLSIELKYAIIAILLVILFIALHVADAFAGVNETVQDGMDRLARLGSIGLFLLALLANACSADHDANATVGRHRPARRLLGGEGIQVPYTLPLLTDLAEPPA
jgi:hypothetical protein